MRLAMKKPSAAAGFQAGARPGGAADLPNQRGRLSSEIMQAAEYPNCLGGGARPVTSADPCRLSRSRMKRAAFKNCLKNIGLLATDRFDETMYTIKTK